MKKVREYKAGVPMAAAKLPAEASKLVGSIVEKGFSTGSSSRSSFTFPEPSLLPFPVAHHRSHGGPDSAPTVCEEERKDEEEQELGIGADFAQPVKRRPKKPLDFSKWKELVSEEHLAETKLKRNSNCHEVISAGVAVKEVPEVNPSRGSTLQAPPSGELSTSIKEISNVNVETSKSGQSIGSSVRFLEETLVDMEPTIFSSSDRAQVKRVQVDQSRRLESSSSSFMSSMNDIDAENNALLHTMSSAQIAQAQEEITGKIKPEIVEMLKMRGRKKMKTQSSSTSDTHNSSEFEAKLDKQSQTGSKEPCQSEHAASGRNLYESMIEGNDNGSTKSSTSTQSGLNNDARKALQPSGNGTWDIWSNRVEAVRNLRFTLEGSVSTEDLAPCKFDSAAERDYLRTEGDPEGAGYTIREALALARSMIAGQRVLALKLLTSVLEKALFNLKPQTYSGCVPGNAAFTDLVDWQAIWAYAIGPEPKIILTLRTTLDSNHASELVVCARAIQCILCCNQNEYYDDLSELLTNPQSSMYTAPVFRVKGELDVGFLNGGFWKYSAKPLSILPFNDNSVDNKNGEAHTISDDISVAELDIAAGLIRMGVLPRIRYIIEMDPNVAVEEHLLSVLIAFARHSPTGTRAIIECPRLIDTVINRFVKKEELVVTLSGVKSVHLLMVLAESSRSACEHFIKDGTFGYTMRYLYVSPVSLEQWLKFGHEYAVLVSSMLIELLRLWKVCICYGHCIDYFSDFFPAMCLWLSPPAIDKLIESKVLHQFTSLTREAYIVLQTLCRRLPILNTVQNGGKLGNNDGETAVTWSWGHVFPVVDSALKWMSLKDNTACSLLVILVQERRDFVVEDSFRNSLISVLTSIMGMFCCILEKVEAHNYMDHSHDRNILFPRFSRLSRIFHQMNEMGLLDASTIDVNGEVPSTIGPSLLENICLWRIHRDSEISINSSCFLHNLVRLIILLKKTFGMINQDSVSGFSHQICFEGEDNKEKLATDHVFPDGLENILFLFINLLDREYPQSQLSEVFLRGGPAPGLGFGWGSCYNFWSMNVLLYQVDAHVVSSLLELYPIRFGCGAVKDETLHMKPADALLKFNAALGVCLILGPKDVFILEKVFKLLFSVPVMKCLSSCISGFLFHNGLGSFIFTFTEEDYHSFSQALASHFHIRWLSRKKKQSKLLHEAGRPDRPFEKSQKLNSLHAIDEEVSEDPEIKCPPHSLVVEWVHQRLPLPSHWFLSPLSTSGKTSISKSGHRSSDDDLSLVIKSGLFFLLGLEATSSLCCDNQSSPILPVPLVWKVHSLSMVFLIINGITLDEQTRAIFEALQTYYGKKLYEEMHSCIKTASNEGRFSPSRPKMQDMPSENCMNIFNFEKDIHANYSKFVETLVEQFASVSYGDITYGRQLAVYLHRSVDVSTRLATWNALSDAHVMELLPSIESCSSDGNGYLFPPEDSEHILEAYAKSWISGSLGKAAARVSVCFTIAIHHLSCLFFDGRSRPPKLRNKLVKSLLRDCSRKQDRMQMFLRLVSYDPSSSDEREQLDRKFEMLYEACEGIQSLITLVEKLKSLSSSSIRG